METKLYQAADIVLDGRMNEAVWNDVPTYTDFRRFKTHGGEFQPEKTYFKILPCEDRIIVGIKCVELGMEEALRNRFAKNSYGAISVQLFFCPSGKPFEFYQFFVGWDGQRMACFASEGGNIEPDPYAPVWRAETYTGEDYWSAEVEIPLTSFYMTPNDRWSDTWLINICRNRIGKGGGTIYSSWAPLEFRFREPDNFRSMGGFPIRPLENDVCISSAIVEVTEKTADGYKGVLTIQTVNAVADDFVFTTDCGETQRVSLQAGNNEFKTPCFFTNLGRNQVVLSLKRERDGLEFKRFYPVRVLYEPLVVQLTLPEFRNNFYPGQDYSKIVGKVITQKPVTVRLEGAGIPAQTVTPDAEGNFSFDTPNFEVGEAYLTATIEGCEVTKKIRRLAPTGHTMAWVSGGNIIVDGEPVIPRKMYGPGYRGGVAFNNRYATTEQHITKKFKRQQGDIQAQSLVRGSETSGGEATQDIMPSEEMFTKLDAIIEKNRDRDFVFYYLADEPDYRAISPIYLKNTYEHIIEKDPYHLVMICSTHASLFIDCADWLQAHPYVIPYNQEDGTRTYERPMCGVGKYIDEVVSLNRSDKCMGFLPTCYAYKNASIRYDYPTLDEMYTQVWAAMIHGGKSLWPYAYHGMNDRPCMYEGFRYLFSSFEALESLVLFGKRTQLYYAEGVEAALFDKGDEKMFVVVNFTQQPQTVTLDGIDGQWYNFRHNGMLSGNTFTLKPMETLIGTSTPKGTELPTYEEVTALIEKEEYRRTHTGSLLFDRFEDMKFRMPRNHRFQDNIKLVDGMLDNLGIELCDQEQNFFEIDLTKVNPTFTKVVVCGYQVDDLTVKVRIGDTETVPAVAEVITEEYATTVILQEPVSPEHLRLEFGKDLVELYEIQVF